MKVTSKHFNIKEYSLYVELADVSLKSINKKLSSRAPEYKDRGLIEYLIFQDELFLREQKQRVADWRKSCKNSGLKRS